MKKSFTLLVFLFFLISMSSGIIFRGINIINESNDQVLTKQKKQSEIEISRVNSMFFIENKGQWNSEIYFRADIQFGNLGLGKGCIYYNLQKTLEPKYQTKKILNKESIINDNERNPTIKSCILKLIFIDAYDIEPKGLNPLPHKNNYFYGNDSSKWITGAMSYNIVEYKNLWDGIDLVYYFNESGFKYEFIVHPGISPEKIKIKVIGHSSMLIENKNLKILTPIKKSIFDKNLKIYYYNNRSSTIKGKFEIINKETFSFAIDKYDPNRKIIIDPLIFSTFVGGEGSDKGEAIEIDSSGNCYVLGKTNSKTFPTSVTAYDSTFNNEYDIFVVKLKPDGSGLSYSTYIGGSGDDWAKDIKVGKFGFVYMTGTTKSLDFPFYNFKNNNNPSCNVFYIQLSPSGGELIYSTAIAGRFDDYGVGIDVDVNEYVYITGRTNSDNFPVTTGAYSTIKSHGTNNMDIFVLKLDLNGTGIIYSTYIGGTNDEYADGLMIDTKGNTYVVGDTYSSDFPITKGSFDTIHNGNSDVFILKLNSDGSKLIFSTFIGGNKVDIGNDIIIDNNENIFITGYTSSTNFPVTEKVFDKTFDGSHEGYVLKIDEMGSSLLFSTFIGGDGNEDLHSITRDTSGDIYLVGIATNLGSQQNTCGCIITQNENHDVLLVKLNNNGSLLLNYALIGGYGNQVGDYIVVDTNGNVYVTGWTTSSDFPTTEGAIYKTYNGGENDVFILKFNFLKKPKVPRDMQVSTGNHYVNLTWNPPVNEDESSIIGYNIYRGNNITDLDLLAIIDNIYWYNDTLLRNGHTYYYQINAINDDCNGTLSIKIPATPITIPAPPYNFEGKLGNKFVNLFWDKPHDNGGANITKYRIYKGKDTGNITVFKTIDSTEQFFNDTDVIIGILYYYFITAINIRGESVSSNLLELTPIGIPKPPQSTKASPGYGSINLTWKKPTDNGSSEIIKYSIYKSTNSSKETFFKSIDANQLFYLDTSVITGTKYFYYLTSINKAGESESSIEIHSIPKKADSTDPGDQVKPEKNADDTQHETTDNSKLLFGIILFTSSIVVLIAVLFFIIKKRSSEKQSSTLHKQQTSSYQNQLSQHHYYPPQPPILQTNLQQQWQQNSQYKCKFCNTIIQDPDICPYCGWIRKF